MPIALLETLDAYLDSAPRSSSTVERIGPFSLFIGTGPWSYYARPAPGLGADVDRADLAAVIARQRELAQAETFEWVCELAPGLADLARAAGLQVRMLPLMALTSPPPRMQLAGLYARILEADDTRLPAAVAAVDVGFACPGTALGPEGCGARDRQIASIGGRIAVTRDLIRKGDALLVAVEAPCGPVAAGSALPRGPVAELTGIATLPAWRRRGIGALVAAALASSVCERGARIAVLSASDDTVARIYARAGFTRVGTIGEASGASCEFVDELASENQASQGRRTEGVVGLH